jgi:hypothetical protein
MGRETLEIFGLGEERDALEARLAALERAHQDLLERVRRYERERTEIRTRLQRILARLGPVGP